MGGDKQNKTKQKKSEIYPCTETTTKTIYPTYTITSDCGSEHTVTTTMTTIVYTTVTSTQAPRTISTTVTSTSTFTVTPSTSTKTAVVTKTLVSPLFCDLNNFSIICHYANIKFQKDTRTYNKHCCNGCGCYCCEPRAPSIGRIVITFIDVSSSQRDSRYRCYCLNCKSGSPMRYLSQHDLPISSMDVKHIEVKPAAPYSEQKPKPGESRCERTRNFTQWRNEWSNYEI